MENAALAALPRQTAVPGRATDPGSTQTIPDSAVTDPGGIQTAPAKALGQAVPGASEAYRSYALHHDVAVTAEALQSAGVSLAQAYIYADALVSDSMSLPLTDLQKSNLASLHADPVAQSVWNRLRPTPAADVIEPDVRAEVMDAEIPSAEQTTYKSHETNEGRVVDNKENYDTIINTGTMRTASKTKTAQQCRGQLFRDGVFPPYKTSHSNSHEIAERWARSEEGRTERRRLLSHRGKWYVIEVVDDGVYGYRIVAKLNDSEYKRRLTFHGTTSRDQSISDIALGNATRHRETDRDEGAGYRADSNQSGYGGENPSVLRVDTDQDGRRKAESNEIGDNRSGSTDRNRRYEPSVTTLRLDALGARAKQLRKSLKSDRVSRTRKTEYRRELRKIQKEMEELMPDYYPSKTGNSDRRGYAQEVARNGQTWNASIQRFENSYEKTDNPEKVGIQFFAIKTQHATERSMQRGLSDFAIEEAISNPLYIGEVVFDSEGRKSVKYVGKEATVVINPDTQAVITTWKTGSRIRRKYGIGD